MKSPTSFDSSRLQIQMKGGAKKQEKNTAKPEARSTRQQQQNSQGRPSPTKRAGNRAKRNLTFDDEGTGGGGGPRVPPRRSPRKRVRSDSVAEGGGDSGEKTPSKKRARLAEETPQKMTPGTVPFNSILFPLALFVFHSDDPQQNVNSFLTPVFNTVFYALSHSTFLFSLLGSSKNQ